MKSVACFLLTLLNMNSNIHFNSNEQLLAYLKNKNIIKSNAVYKTMSCVDRKKFTTNSQLAYVDEPHLNAYNKSISSPHMHAKTLELLADKLKSGTRALDIGSGSGYLTACMALLMEEKGRVIGIDCIPQFQNMANNIICKNYPELQTNGQVKFVVGDGRLGYSSEGPYDAIHVGAAAAEVPQALLDQLAPGGRLIMPIGDKPCQMLTKFNKTSSGEIERIPLFRVRYGFLSKVNENIDKNKTICNKKENTFTIIKDSSKNNVNKETNALERLHLMEEIVNKKDAITKEKIDQLEKSIGNIEKRLDAMQGLENENLNKLQNKLESLENRLELVSSNLQEFETKITKHENVFKSVEKQNEQLNELKYNLDSNGKQQSNELCEQTASESKLIGIVEQALQLQELILRQTNVKSEKMDANCRDLQKKLETISDDLKTLNSKLKRSVLCKCVDEELKDNDSTDDPINRLETVETELKGLKDKSMSLPSIMEYVNDALIDVLATQTEKQKEEISSEMKNSLDRIIENFEGLERRLKEKADEMLILK